MYYLLAALLLFIGGAPSLSAQSTSQLPLSITSTRLPLAQVGQPYSTQLESVGGVQPVVWSFNSVGFLKDVVRVSPDGILSLTPSEAIADTISVTARDATGRSATESLIFESARGTLRLLTSTAAYVTYNQSYDFQLQATGGAPPYQFEDFSTRIVVSADPNNPPELPPASALTSTLELTLSGQIRGIGSPIFPFKRILVRDSQGNAAMRYIIFPSGPPGVSITRSLPLVRLGEPVRQQIGVTGAPGPWTFFYNFTANHLPPGLALDTSGLLTGTPNVRGTYSFVVEARDSSFLTRLYNIVTMSIDGGPLRFLTTTLPPAPLNQPYSQTIRISGGQEPLRIELATPANTLPPGLALSSAGVLAGTPTSPGAFTFSIRALDLQNRNQVQEFTLRVTGGAVPSLVSSLLPEARRNTPYSFTLSPTGGTPPYAFALLSGALPPGLSLATTGAITGTPSANGSFPFSVRLQDAITFVDLPLTLTVAAAPSAPTITLGPITPATVLHPFSRLAFAEGGVAPYSWELVSGALPPGINPQISSGILSLVGAPLAAGDYEVVYRLRDAAGMSADSCISLSVARPSALPPAVLGSSYETRLPAGTNFSRPNSSPGLLPLGLTLAPDGALSGTPRASGHFLFGVTYRDSASQLRNATFLLSVNPSGLPKIDAPIIPGATVGLPYRWAPQISTDSLPRTATAWSIQEGNLPAGLNLNATTGEISGTPTTPGATSLRLAARTGDVELLHGISIFVAPSNSPTLAALRNAASYADGGLAPGEILTAFGSRLGPSTLTAAVPSSSRFPTSIEATSVRLEGIPVPLLYAADSQLSFVAPFQAPGQWVSVVVQNSNRTSAPTMLQIVPARPGLFTADGSGSGPAALLNQDGSLNTQSNPAAPGSVIVVFFTGAGEMSPPPVDGAIATTASSLSVPLTATINGSPAEVLYAGHSPGSIVGLVQANLRVPLDAPSGAVSLQLTQASAKSAPNVTVWLR